MIVHHDLPHFRQFGEHERYLHAKIVEGGVLFHRNRFAEALALFTSLVGPAKELGDVPTIARLYGVDRLLSVP